MSNSFNWKLKLCRVCSIHQTDCDYTTIFLLSHVFKGDKLRVSLFHKHINIGFFLDTNELRSFKLCMSITLLGVYQFIPHLMTLTLFQGHRCVRIIKCKLLFRFLSNVKSCMLWTLRVTGVYLRDIADTFCSVLHLNVSQNKRLFFLLDYNLLNPAKQKKKKKKVCVWFLL